MTLLDYFTLLRFPLLLPPSFSIGYARMVDFSIGFTSASHAGAMRAAERGAKVAQLRLWKDWTPRTVVGEKDYDGEEGRVV